MEREELHMADSLCGIYYPSIDAKGRMSFPTKLREVLGAELYLCAGSDNTYIAVYSSEGFDEYQNKLLNIPGKLGSNIRRKLLSCTDKQVPDKQGRIFIAQHLREFAGISGEVVVIGSGNKAEIWDKAKWNEFDNEISQEQIDAALSEFVL